MATSPQFSSFPIVGSAAVNALADTSYTAPVNTVTVVTATGARQFTDGKVTVGTTTLTSPAKAAFAVGDVGRPVSGTGIPSGTVILSVVSATKATMSKPATATHTPVTVTLGGGYGAQVLQVTCVGNSATATKAGMVNLFLKDPAGVFHFINTFLITAVTPAATVAPFGAGVMTSEGTWKPQNLFLPAGWSLCASSFTATQHITVNAFGGAY